MPIENDWASPPISEEEAVKQVIQRTSRLITGLCGELNTLHNNCKHFFSNPEEDLSIQHYPFLYVRYNGKDENGVEYYEYFYICQHCLSQKLIQNPSIVDDIDILRGEPSTEAKHAVHAYTKQVKESKRET